MSKAFVYSYRNKQSVYIAQFDKTHALSNKKFQWLCYCLLKVQHSSTKQHFSIIYSESAPK